MVIHHQILLSAFIKKTNIHNLKSLGGIFMIALIAKLTAIEGKETEITKLNHELIKVHQSESALSKLISINQN